MHSFYFTLPTASIFFFFSNLITSFFFCFQKWNFSVKFEYFVIFLPEQGIEYRWLRRNLENLVCELPSVYPQQKIIEILLSPLQSLFQSFFFSFSFPSRVPYLFSFLYPELKAYFNRLKTFHFAILLFLFAKRLS